MGEKEVGEKEVGKRVERQEIHGIEKNYNSPE